MRRALATAAVTVAVVLVPTAAWADWSDQLPGDSAGIRVRAIEPRVRAIEPRVREVAQTRSDGAAKVIDLSTDLLFAFGKADVNPAANAKLAELVKPVPQGASVQVFGHTDGIGDNASNLTLSRARAEAVASIIRTARPDLKLDVQGFGETKPLAAEGGKDDGEARAKNRRVEVRYQG